ncbi:MAG: hypothetical protein ACRDHL_08340 [Candidatus Promineifilaceae bacterium]
MNIFNVSTESQDIEALLGQVGDQLRQWEGGRRQPLDLSLMLGAAGQGQERAARLKTQWNLNGAAIVQSSRPRLGPWLIRFQHLVRRLTWWYLEPILLQLRAFQMNAAHTIAGLADAQERLLAHNQSQAEQFQALQSRLEALEARPAATPAAPEHDEPADQA